MKLTARETALAIIRDGEIIETEYEKRRINLVVRALGQTYKIEDAYGKRPTITHLKECDEK